MGWHSVVEDQVRNVGVSSLQGCCPLPPARSSMLRYHARSYYTMLPCYAYRSMGIHRT